MTDTTNATPNLIDALVNAVIPTLDEAMDAYAAYEASGGADNFHDWNEKWMGEYIDRKFENLGTPSDTSTPSKTPSKPSEPSKATKPTKTSKAPSKSAKPAADSKKPAPVKPAAITKSGKFEITLTPAEKAKREAQLLTVTETVRKETSNIATSYMRIGFQLWRVREKKLYLAADMKNVCEYSETAFGFKASSSKNFIAICEKFSCKDKDGNPTDKIDPAFALFGYSQLSEMLPLSDEMLVNVKPEMTIKEIRGTKGQTSDQSSDTDPDETPAKPTKSVYYDGEVTVQTWDRLLEKLEKLIDSGKHIQITVTD